MKDYGEKHAFGLSQSITYGDALTLTGSSSGLVNGDSAGYSLSGVTSANYSTSGNIEYGTYTIVAGGALGLGYSVTATNGTLSVATKAITISGFAVSDKDYDGARTATVSNAGTVSGQVTNDLVSILSVTAEFVDKHAGLDKILTVGGTLAGADGDNYTASISGTTRATINALAVTLTAPNITKDYDGLRTYTTTSANLASLSALLVGGDTVTAATLAYTNENAATGTKVVTTANASISDGNSGNNYIISYANNTTSTIAKAPITVTADAQSRYYGEANPVLSQTLSGFVNGETLADSGVTGSDLGSTTATASSAVATYTITASSAGYSADNYRFVTANGVLTVNARPITITADLGQTKIYGNADATFTYTVEANSANRGLFGSDTFSGALARVSGENIGTYAINQGTLANSNYAISYVSRNYSITQRPITLSANAATKTYGDADPSLGVTIIAGSLASVAVTDSLADVTGTLTRASGSNVGLYNIALGSGTKAANYAISYEASNFAITKATLHATGAKVYDGLIDINGANLSITGVLGESFSATGTATMQSKNVQTAAALADVVGLTYTGNNGALASNYFALDQANTSVDVTVKSVTISPSSGLTKTYDGGRSYITSLADLSTMSQQLVGGDQIVSATVLYSSAGAGSNKRVDINALTVDDGNDGLNYNISLSYISNGVISKAPLTITAADDAKFVTKADVVASSGNPGYAGLLINGFVNGETTAQLTGAPTITRTNFAQNDAGTYPNVLQPAGYSSNNYAISYVNGDYTIVSAEALLVRVSPATVTYGSAPTYTVTAQYLPPVTQADPSPTPVTLTPVNNGSITVSDGAGGSAVFTISAVTTAVDFSSTGNLAVGAYNLAASGTTIVPGNFNAMTLVGTLAVNAKQLAASALGVSGITKVYDGSAAISVSELNYTASSNGVLAGDSVTVSAIGRFVDSAGNPDANVGANKFINVDLALAGADARNYSLSSTQLSDDLNGVGSGSVTQLAAVTWVGPATDGYWSNAGNWAGGAIPTFSNVRQVTIPTSVNVIYDSALVGAIGSSIINNGVITFSGSNDFTLANTISGSGSINQSGAGLLRVSGNNSFAGGININSSRLLLAHANALGTGSITSNGGSLALLTSVTLPQLTVNGAVTISTDIRTVGAQTYNGAVSLTGGNAVAGVVTPLNMTTNNANIVFASTLDADSNSYVNKRSLTITVGSGAVTFNGMVGSQYATYNDFINRSSDLSLYRLIVNAATLNLNADVTTFETQTYNTSVLVGDNGLNGLTRVLLSEDPAIIFNGTVDDTVANTHSLVVKAVSLTSNVVPEIEFNEAVGSIKALASLEVLTGTQNPDVTSVFSDTSSNPSEFNGKISIAANVTTIGNQTYTANTMAVGSASITDPLATNEINMVSQQGSITYNLGSNTNTQAGLIGVGTGAKLNAKYGRGGAVHGLDTGAVNSSLVYKVEAYYQPVVNERGAGFFTRLINRSVDHSINNRDVDEVVEVGEVGLLEDGKVKRIEDEDPLCGTFGHDICEVK